LADARKEDPSCCQESPPDPPPKEPAHRAAPRLQTDRKLYGEEQLVREMVETCLKLLRDRTRVADVKLLNAALRELRYAFKVFAPYAGSAR